MRIYADFNGVEMGPEPADEWRLELTGYGTLASLSRYRIKLGRGLVLAFSDPDGLSVVAPVDFDAQRISDNSSGWYAKFKKTEVHDGEPLADDNTHPCFSCRNDLKAWLDNVGRQYRECCPHCDTPVLYPLSPP